MTEVQFDADDIYMMQLALRRYASTARYKSKGSRAGYWKQQLDQTRKTMQKLDELKLVRPTSSGVSVSVEM